MNKRDSNKKPKSILKKRSSREQQAKEKDLKEYASDKESLRKTLNARQAQQEKTKNKRLKKA